MFSHVTVGCSDLEAAGHFYDAVLTPLGLVRRLVVPDGGPASVCWVMSGTTLPRFYAYHPYDGRRCSVGNGGIVAFAAPDEVAVDRAYGAGLQLGGTSRKKAARSWSITAIAAAERRSRFSSLI